MNLIFGETHNDTIVARILLKLLPVLKQMGFTHYFDETLRNSTIENEINEINLLETIHQKLEIFFAQNRLHIYSSTDWDKCIDTGMFHNNRLLAFLGISQNEFDLNQEAFYFYATFRENRQTYKLFLENLAHENIIYQGIDSDIRKSWPGQPLNTMILHSMSIRDREMASHYMASSNHVFGRCGIRHFLGMQTEMLRVMPYENAKNKSIFIYISSLPENAREYLEKDHPLGIHYFDATKLTEHEIMQGILSLVSQNQEHHQRYRHLSRLSIFPSINRRENYSPLHQHEETYSHRSIFRRSHNR